MKGMRRHKQGQPLQLDACNIPDCQDDEVLIRVSACAVCRTDLHVCDGDLSEPKLPVIPDHEIIGYVISYGANVKEFKTGDRVGVPWLGFTCGDCVFCQNGQGNLCDEARFTGYQIDGGFTDYMVAHHRFVFKPDSEQNDTALAPLRSGKINGAAVLVTECHHST